MPPANGLGDRVRNTGGACSISRDRSGLTAYFSAGAPSLRNTVVAPDVPWAQAVLPRNMRADLKVSWRLACRLMASRSSIDVSTLSANLRCRGSTMTAKVALTVFTVLLTGAVLAQD